MINIQNDKIIIINSIIKVVKNIKKEKGQDRILIKIYIILLYIIW